MKPIFFASGPSQKFEGWNSSIFEHDLLNRTHIHHHLRDFIKESLVMMKEILKIPDNYKIFFVPGSGSGALFCAFANFLHENSVEIPDTGFFSNEWYKDLHNQFKLDIKLVDYDTELDADKDNVIVWVDTTNGFRYSNKLKRGKGIKIIDAVSAAFVEDLPFEDVDIVAFSLQKVLGGDGSVGVLAINERAQERLALEKNWPVPRAFNINRWKLDELVNGRWMSTPSVLALIELHHILKWVKKNGDLAGLQRNARQNLAILEKFLDHSSLQYLIKEEKNRARAVVCLELCWHTEILEEKMNKISEITKKAEEMRVFDIGNFANPSWRFWIGPTQCASDIEIGFERFFSLFNKPIY